MGESFYLIWRNQYIRRMIRNIVCQGVVINVDKEYMCDNQQYLSLFTNKEKLDYNISIRFKGDTIDYLDINNNRDMINVVDLKIKADFNFNEIHDGVHTLLLKLANGKRTAGMGQLPDSITKLTFFAMPPRTGAPPIVQHLISNLPCKLQELSFTYIDDCIHSRCVLPQSLTDLHYAGLCDSMKWLVVPPNKLYKRCDLELDSYESFQWLLENKFIGKIRIGPGAIPVLKSHPLPSHVTDVNLEYGVPEPDLLLPHTVERLYCSNSGTPFSHITQLKLLNIYDEYSIKLEKGVLPRSLESLFIRNNQPLEADVLPPTLTSLYMYRFNQPLCINVLPLSLTDLYLGAFNQPLNAFVLPSKLKKLNLRGFEQPTFFANSLPVSLTRLYLDAFKGSFDQCQPLDNLKRLRIDSLVPSVAGIVTNVKKLDLEVDTEISDPSGTCLANTSIESLYLSVKLKSTLYPNSLPPTIKYLSLVNVVIESDNVIPSSCRYLKSRNSKIDPISIPKSARYLKSIQ
ncbi:hypothetical protein CYY_000254 [Polysphondylium violaceum]|uniref:Uncharacterized protein n=1 Tax=Polysphondylium violaceum TaxID=133409 RepID=A0A8J4Q571_9MYCE|nr:hypothetical protein CYY_000254 [Polysphondylium violaceum]